MDENKTLDPQEVIEETTAQPVSEAETTEVTKEVSEAPSRSLQ